MSETFKVGDRVITPGRNSGEILCVGRTYLFIRFDDDSEGSVAIGICRVVPPTLDGLSLPKDLCEWAVAKAARIDGGSQLQPDVYALICAVADAVRAKRAKESR